MACLSGAVTSARLTRTHPVTIQREHERRERLDNTLVTIASEPVSFVTLPSSATSAEKALDLLTLGKPTT